MLLATMSLGCRVAPPPLLVPLPLPSLGDGNVGGGAGGVPVRCDEPGATAATAAAVACSLLPGAAGCVRESRDGGGKGRSIGADLQRIQKNDRMQRMISGLRDLQLVLVAACQ